VIEPDIIETPDNVARSVARLNQLQQDLEQAQSIEEVLDIKKKAEALRRYFADHNECAEVVLRCAREIGERLLVMPKHEGGRPSENLSQSVTGFPEKIEDLGITRNDSSRWQTIAQYPDEKFENYIHTTREKQEELTMAALHRLAKRYLKEEDRELHRDENRQEIARAETIEEALGLAKFSTIVIDPPWDWGDENDVDQLGRAVPIYGTMPIGELLQLPVGSYADTDCHLYLWITNRSLPKGFQLLERWGFRYVTCVTWVKPYYGMGNYFRGQTEHLLFGVKGSLPLKRNNVGTVFNAPRGARGHSSKPLQAYELIESCSPGPYLELFARSERDDWTSWGAEV
jgi:N6-adenosine-specific RNA methylase IME4